MSLGRKIKYAVILHDDSAENRYDKHTNSSVEKKIRKKLLANSGKIHCVYCRYHRSENKSGSNRREVKNWKYKFKKQYSKNREHSAIFYVTQADN